MWRRLGLRDLLTARADDLQALADALINSVQMQSSREQQQQQQQQHDQRQRRSPRWTACLAGMTAAVCLVPGLPMTWC